MHGRNAAILFCSLMPYAACICSDFKSLTLDLTSRKNATGHWITQVAADYQGDAARSLNVKIESLDTVCNGDKGISLKAVVSAPPPVRDDYELFNGIGYYKFHTDKKNWQDAKSTCEKEGGHLAIINSLEESQVLKSIYERHPESEDVVHIGFHDMFKEGDYVTILGQPLSESGFYTWSTYGANQPDDAQGAEDCGSIHRNGYLNDIRCERELEFICEHQLW